MRLEKRTSIDDVALRDFVFVGVLCLSNVLHVFGIVDVLDGNEHLIPENFSTFRRERRGTIARDSRDWDNSEFLIIDFSWWPFDIDSRCVKCNEDVRRTVLTGCPGLLAINDCSDRLTMVDKLLNE